MSMFKFRNKYLKLDDKELKICLATHPRTNLYCKNWGTHIYMKNMLTDITHVDAEISISLSDRGQVKVAGSRSGGIFFYN